MALNIFCGQSPGGCFRYRVFPYPVEMLGGRREICSFSLQQLASPIACRTGKCSLCSLKRPAASFTSLAQPVHYSADWRCCVHKNQAIFVAV